ncbi:MAG: protein kinase [Nitrospirae bacterium]|nr:protein kinase [Nitrospirota bacterium]
MPAKVTLKVTNGKLKGKEYEFASRTTCIVGRGVDCYPRLPDDDAHRVISRHHCLLDINPPDIRVRDMGSLNATYINGKNIGQRDAKAMPHAGQSESFPEYDLKHNDELKLGETIFQIIIVNEILCVECSTEIPPDKLQESKISENIYKCEACRKIASTTNTETMVKVPVVSGRVCSGCNTPLPEKEGEGRSGDILCAKCKGEPSKLLKFLMVKAEKGDKSLVSIQGYNIIRELGKGGMGAVYLAEKNGGTGSSEQVALKLMLPEVAVNKGARDMFLREVANTKVLHHPNIVQLIDFGSSSGTFFFTLEFCNGGAIDTLMIKQGGKLSVEKSMDIIFQALDGLEYAHNIEIPEMPNKDGVIHAVKGLVHRDIKPANIFLTKAGDKDIAKIADFGLGKAFDTAGLSGQTRTGSAGGTPVFIPRQQVINFKYAKPEVDVWAMAATLYYMLTARFPRDFPKGKDPWRIVLQSKPVPILNRIKTLPVKLAKVIDEALIDQPSITFKTAIEFKKALEGAL